MLFAKTFDIDIVAIVVFVWHCRHLLDRVLSSQNIFSIDVIWSERSFLLLSLWSIVSTGLLTLTERDIVAVFVQLPPAILQTYQIRLAANDYFSLQLCVSVVLLIDRFVVLSSRLAQSLAWPPTYWATVFLWLPLSSAFVLDVHWIQQVVLVVFFCWICLLHPVLLFVELPLVEANELPLAEASLYFVLQSPLVFATSIRSCLVVLCENFDQI